MFPPAVVVATIFEEFISNAHLEGVTVIGIILVILYRCPELHQCSQHFEDVEYKNRVVKKEFSQVCF